MLLKSTCFVLEKNYLINMFVFSSKFETILIMLLFAFHCIKFDIFDIFEIFFDEWFLMHA
jgi:hypothetical protein